MYWPSIEGVELHRSELGLLMPSDSPWCQPLLSSPLRCLTRTCSFALLSWVQSSYCLAWVIAMGVYFVCLWLDHYLHQYGGCGPLGATWLEGIATFTTTRDQCTETVLSLIRPLLDVFTWYFRFQSMLPCDLCFHWDACSTCLDDVRCWCIPHSIFISIC